MAAAGGYYYYRYYYYRYYYYCHYYYYSGEQISFESRSSANSRSGTVALPPSCQSSKVKWERESRFHSVGQEAKGQLRDGGCERDPER